MPVQYGFPPEAEASVASPGWLPDEGAPTKTGLEMLAEQRASKKDGSDKVTVDSPPPGDKGYQRLTPSKTVLVAKKRSGSSLPAVKNPKNARA